MRIGKLKNSLVKITQQPTGLYWDDSYRSDDVNSTTAYTQNYNYDLMGNLNSLQHIGYNSYTRAYNHADNLLESFEVGSNTYYYQYDVCGNQIQENEERHMQWDYADKLRLYYNQTSSGSEPSVYTHYLYDAGGNRVKKYTRTAGGNWETITYIDGLIEYREDQDGKIQSINHVMDDTKRIATIRDGYDFGDTTPKIKYNFDDHLGSSNILVDDSGALVNQEEYYPFGETSFGSYAKKRYRFCGKEKDEETRRVRERLKQKIIGEQSGMYYYGARYYSPWLCRFIGVDPLAGKYVFQTPYAYADNNPINKMDYNGEGTGESETKAASSSGNAPSSSTENGTTNNLTPQNNSEKFKELVTIDENLKPEKPKIMSIDEAKVKLEKKEITKKEFKEIESQWNDYKMDVERYNWFQNVIDKYANAPDNTVEAELRDKIVEYNKPIVLTNGQNKLDPNSELGEMVPITQNKEWNYYPNKGPDYFLIRLDYNRMVLNTAYNGSPKTPASIKYNSFENPSSLAAPSGESILAHELGHMTYFMDNISKYSDPNADHNLLGKESEGAAQKWEYKFYKQNFK